MPEHLGCFSHIRTLQRIFSFHIAFALCLGSAAWAAEPAKSFSIAAGPAETTLKSFSEQSGRSVMFATAKVKGITTNEVKGSFPVEVALDHLLSGTKLSAIPEKETGGFAIRREATVEDAGKNVSGRPVHGTTARTEGGAIELDSFQVRGVREPGPVNQGVIPRTVDGAMPFQLFDRQSIERSGAMTLGEFFRNVSGNTSAGLGYQTTFAAALNSAAPGPGDTSDRVNLRGLGNARTVVLLNGRRLYGSDTQGPDVSRIPLASVDRVEILSGAAAAIYGANAAGGVVNIITRKNFNGGEVSLYGGTSTAGGANEWHAGLFYGFSGNEGRTSGTIAVEHVDRGELRASDRAYYERAAARIPSSSAVFFRALINMIGGSRPVLLTSAAAGLGIPANPTAKFATVPANYNPTAGTPADFNATAGQALIDYTRIGQMLLQSPQKVESINMQAEHKFIKDRLEAYTELAWRYQDGSSTTPGLVVSGASVAAGVAGNPFAVSTQVYWNPVEFPLDSLYALQRTTRAVAGLKGKLGVEKKWAWALDYSFDRNEAYTRYVQNTASMSAAILAGRYRPFRDLGSFPNNITPLSDFQDRNSLLTRPNISSGNLRVSGQLWEWAGGKINLSAGAEVREEQVHSVQTHAYGPISAASFGDAATLAIFESNLNITTDSSRQAEAEYAELSVPLIGRDNRLPLVEALEMDFAVRHEAYGSYAFDTTTGTHSGTTKPANISGTPVTLAAKWQPVRDVTFRASYGGTFVSPRMTDFFAARSSSLLGAQTYFDPVLNATVTAPAFTITRTSGGNPNIRPEKGRSYNYGVLLAPRWLPQFTASFDYFKVLNQDRIATPSLQTTLLFFPERVTRDATNNVTAIDLSRINMARAGTSGFDTTVSWKQPTQSLGEFTLTANATYTDVYKLRLISGAAYQKAVGDRSIDTEAPLRLKSNISLFWTRNALTAGVTARYLAHYKDAYNTNLAGTALNAGAERVDGDHIGSSTEFDVQGSYQFGAENEGWARFFSRTKITLGARNVFDRVPPYNTGSQAFYSFYNDPRQRYIYLELKRSF